MRVTFERFIYLCFVFRRYSFTSVATVAMPFSVNVIVHENGSAMAAISLGTSTTVHKAGSVLSKHQRLQSAFQSGAPSALHVK